MNVTKRVPERPPSTRPLLLLLIGVVAVATVSVSGMLAWRDHLDHQRQTERFLGNLAGLVEEHVRVMLSANRIQLDRVAELLDGRPPAAAEAAALRTRLLDLVDDLPGGHSLWVFDADAEMVVTTVDPDARLNVADREYFTALREGAAVFVSPMIWGKLTGGHFFVMSRRLADADGNFLGIVMSGIEADYVLRRWGELAPYADAAIAVVKHDGGVVLRRPPPPAGVEVRLPPDAPELQAMLAGPDAGVRAIRDLNAVGSRAAPERLGAYRRLDDLGLVVVASRNAEAIAQPWRVRTLEQGAVAAVMLALLAVLGTLVVRSAGALDRKAELLARAVADKDLLFQEIHHRIKNNLQIVGSMLTMQSLLVEDGRAKAVLKEALDRIQTMGLVHQTLYQHNEAADVDLAAYLQSVVEHFRRSYAAEEAGITITALVERHMVEMDRAIPLALIVTEALTNALKHAFPDGRPGNIGVTLSVMPGRTILIISDDGVGMPPRLAGGSGASLGMRLIRSLAEQIGSTVEVEATSRGTRLLVDIPDDPAEAAAEGASLARSA